MCFSGLTFPIHCNALKQPQVLFVWLTTWTTCTDPCRLHSICQGFSNKNTYQVYEKQFYGLDPIHSERSEKKTSTRQLHNKIIETLSDWFFVFHQPQLAYFTGTILTDLGLCTGDFSIVEKCFLVSRFVDRSHNHFTIKTYPFFFTCFFFGICALCTVSLWAILDS